MASLLERSMYPQMDTSGLTSGVDYFGNVGRRRDVFLNRAAPTIAAADTEVPQGTGFVSSGSESGFASGMGGGGGSVPTADQAFGLSMTGAGMGLLGQATNTPELGVAGGFLGASAAASRGNFGPMAGLTTGLMTGDPNAATAASLGVGALQGSVNRGSVIDAVAGRAVPGYNVANLGLIGATGFFGDTPTSIGDVIGFGLQGYDTFGNVGPIDAAQGGKTVALSQNPAATLAAVQGTPFSSNPQALEDASRAMQFAYNTPMDPGMGINANQQSISNINTIGMQDYGTFGVNNPGMAMSYGMDTNAAGQTVSSPASIAAQDAMTFGGTGMSMGSVGGGAEGSIDNSMSLSDMMSSQESGFGSSDSGGDPSAGMGGASEGSAGSTAATADSPDGPDGANAGWKDGGMIGDMPGLTKRYNNGGMVSGGPMLAMGYADGGMMGQMGGKPTPAIVNKRVDAMLRDPRTRQSLLARPQQLMASGELTPDEVTTMARVAEASLYNPELYPQLRQFVAQQGMSPLPAAFDQSVIMRIMAIARGLQSSTPAGQVPGTDQAQMQRPVPGDGNGGYLQGPGTGRSDSIGTVNETTGEPVKVANGEYVIPAHVVRAKGREFFDNLLRRYSDVPKGE